MYCSSCGENIKNEDKYCKHCGEKQDSLRPGQKKAQQKQSSSAKKSSNDTTWKIAIAVVFIVISAAVLLMILGEPGGEGEAYEYTVRVDAGKVADDDQRVKNCSNCENIILEYSNGEKQTIALGKHEGTESLRHNLITKQRHTNEFNLAQHGKSKAVDISLDISGSVVELDKKQKNRGTTKVYSDLLLEELNAHLRENLTPGDKLSARLYGPTYRENPCRGELDMHYTGPTWEAEYFYSERQKKLIVDVKEKKPSKVFMRNGVIVSNDINLIMEKISKFYKENLNKDNRHCHSNTALDQQLVKIIDDSPAMKADNRYFILINDGEFEYGGRYIAPHAYGGLHQYINKNKPFKLDGKTLCDQQDNRGGTKDTFVVLGLDYQNNLDYRQTVQEFFNVILEPCKIQYVNI